MRVGMIGLGRMGGAMARRLLDRGHEVAGWNRTLERARDIPGLSVMASPSAVAGAAEIIIVMLLDEHASRAVYHGENGLLAAGLAGRTIIDMSTLRPDTMAALERDVQGQGGGFAACPVGGTVGPARNGTLLGLLGADPAMRGRVKPLLADLCDRIQEFDTVGAAAAMKLAINLPLLVFFQALGEAAVIARAQNVPPERFIEIMSGGVGSPPALKGRAAAVIAAMHGEEAGEPAFSLEAVEKDLRLMDEEGEHIGYSLRTVKAVRSMVHEAVREGWEGRDLASLAAFDMRA
ncbi:MAG TPA: NAD(P)-dependent oxidoreductase [Acetobacteraceae bacterium]|nr:NAD(P)-dependent oxidoreductase [Acetobacteraceae bacterium]